MPSKTYWKRRAMRMGKEPRRFSPRKSKNILVRLDDDLREADRLERLRLEYLEQNKPVTKIVIPLPKTKFKKESLMLCLEAHNIKAPIIQSPILEDSDGQSLIEFPFDAERKKIRMLNLTSNLALA